MNAVESELAIQHDAPIGTWFKVGGSADALARPESVEELVQCLEIDPDARVLGDGANLLVDDEGVGELVVSLQTPGFRTVEWDQSSGLVRAGAGVALPKLISDAVNRGLGGIEVLAGIPATLGGALVMNAGGAFGDIASVVERVYAVDRVGREHSIDRSRIDYAYRRSGLNHLIVTGADLRLTPGDAEALRTERLRCMTYKKDTQPLGEKSAGCCFKNPTLAATIDGVGERDQRVSAGKLIDRAGCKGLTVGGASVSDVHANFIVTTPDARARDVIEVMERVEVRVLDTFGLPLEREVVVWTRSR